MFRVLLAAIGLGIVVALPNKEDMPKCSPLMHGGLACCKKEIATQMPPEDVKECFQMGKKPPPSCDFEICMAKKAGVASDDGTIDKIKMTAEVETRFEQDPDLVDNIKQNCIDGNVSKYGPPDFCELTKQKLCFDVQIIKSCDEWNDEGDCSGMKELAAECVKKFA